MKRAAMVLAAAALLALAGCSEARHMAASLASSSKPYEEFLEDKAALTTIKTIAIFPFENKAPQPGFDADDFASKLANQLAAAGKVRVVYPNQLLAHVDRENRRARRHNAQLREKRALGLIRPEDDVPGDTDDLFRTRSTERDPLSYQDPVHNMGEAVRLARMANADAIIVGEVTDFDPYMRPRMSVTMRLIATGNTQAAANAIAEMTQWGVPRTGGGSGVANGTIYVRQEMFDSSIGSVGMDVSKYGRSHIVSQHPYDTEVFVRSMSHYYDVVAFQLAKAYTDARKKAVKEAEERAREAARQQKRDQEDAVRRLQALMDRDSRIPDHESNIHPEGYFDQAFPDKHSVMRSSYEDRRIQSWRDGPAVRRATPYERAGRDMAIPENERGRGLEGYKTMVDSAFPDADAYLEMNMGDNRDRSWRADYYNHANPQKSAKYYDQNQYVGQ